MREDGAVWAGARETRLMMTDPLFSCYVQAALAWFLRVVSRTARFLVSALRVEAPDDTASATCCRHATWTAPSLMAGGVISLCCLGELSAGMWDNTCELLQEVVEEHLGEWYS